MGKKGRSSAEPRLLPADPLALLQKMVLGIGQAAKASGVTVRQLSYWTDKGFVKPAGQGNTRSYDWPAIEKTNLIKQALEKGCALDAAAAAAEEFLRARDEERLRVRGLSGGRLQQYLLQQADFLQRTAGRLREEVTLARSSRVGQLTLSFSGMETLLRFLQSSLHTATTADEIASRLGQPVKQVEAQLAALEKRRLVQRLRYPGSEVWRYTPQRAS